MEEALSAKSEKPTGYGRYTLNQADRDIHE